AGTLGNSSPYWPSRRSCSARLLQAAYISACIIRATSSAACSSAYRSSVRVCTFFIYGKKITSTLSPAENASSAKGCFASFFRKHFDELVAIDRFFFKQIIGKFMHFILVFLQNFHCAVVTLFENLLHFLVDFRRGLRRHEHPRLIAQIRMHRGLQRHHAEFVAHAVTGHH